MKIPFLISGCALLFIVTGCFQNESEVEVSPTFDNEFGEMFGIDQKLGIVGGPVLAGESQKWMWHFWGEEAPNQYFSAVATNLESKEEVNPIIQSAILTQRDSLETISHSPSEVQFPSEGLWKIKTYIEDEFFDEFVVEVHPEGTEITY
ncbi:DUF4871 domain-containing protein [Alkalihalobacillus sp. FSL R5-0424]